jgi:cytochrome P450
MLDELTTILFAGRDTTAALMTNLFFLISRHPHVWTRIRADVAFLKGSKPTHEQLKGMDYLQACLKETLRLLPVIPLNTRMAIRDTVLPRGGGPDGQSPIVVPAGTNIAFHVTALHRGPELWGDNAEEYKPERWESMKTNWKYQPFGMGPRNCPGQHLSLAEAAYTTCRLAQEFKEVKPLEYGPWEEPISLTCTSASGAQVQMVPA